MKTEKQKVRRDFGNNDTNWQQLFCSVFLLLILSSLFCWFALAFVIPPVGQATEILTQTTLNSLDAEQKLLENKPKQIALYWTKFHGKDINNLETTYYCDRSCILKVTSSREYFDYANGILFHSPDISWDKLPPRVVTRHNWVLIANDSPLFDVTVSNQSRLSKFDSIMRYRLDSTIPTPHGRDIQLPGDLPAPLEIKKKNAPIVWIADDCHTPNRRDRFVHELMHFIKVDSYGKCLHNKELPKGKSLNEVIREYKFVIAFEHSNCKDFVTEIFWRAIQLGVVPIVMGAPNIDDFAPTFHSIIKVNDYSGPKQLADYLHLLDKNDTLYNEYINYKYDSTLVKPRFFYYLKNFHYKDPWCELCYLLQEKRNHGRKLRPDLTCHNKWTILKQLREGGGMAEVPEEDGDGDAG